VRFYSVGHDPGSAAHHLVLRRVRETKQENAKWISATASDT
jgi:hypothetical protein